MKARKIIRHLGACRSTAVTVCNENALAEQLLTAFPPPYYCMDTFLYTENNVAFSIFGSTLIQSEVMSMLVTQGYNQCCATPSQPRQTGRKRDGVECG